MFSTFSPPEQLAETEPLFNAPTGPVWLVQAAEILDAEQAGDHAYLVRRLPNVRSMLRVAPLLEQVTRFDHPRLWGPSYWTRGEDGVWVATPQPRGVRLVDADLGRLSWAEALDLWRPLAEAVTRLHRRGMVHGAIAPWNVWVDEAAWKLTAIDAGCWIGEEFDDLADEPDERVWLAAEMRGAVDERDPSAATDVYGLGRLLARLTLDPAQARAQRPNYTGIPAFAIPAIEASLSDEPSRRPARVAEFVGATVPRALHETTAPDEPLTDTDTVSVLHARVSDIERLTHPKFGAGVKFYLNCEHLPGPAREHGGRLGAFFYEKPAADVFDSVKWVWEGCELNLIDARVVQNSAGERFLTSQASTLPVLEPHMPMSVSDVLKAEGCPSRFLVDQRDRGESSRPLVFGNLVHGLLDDLVEPEPPDFETAFAARVADLRLDLVAAGLRDRDLGKLRDDAQQHFANIQRYTTRRTGQSAAHDRVGWSGRNVEVTRYSTRYGIEGRVDLVAQDDREGLQIVELKTGSTWDGHLSQLRFYKFLWEGLADARDLEVTGHILYSRPGRMQAAPMEDTERERRILRARNQLIACLRSFVDPGYEYDVPFFMQNPPVCKAPSCKFRRSRCAQQTEVLGLADAVSPWDASSKGRWKDASPEVIARAWAWHRHFARLIEMERWAATAELGAVLHPARLAERRENFAAADDLELVRAYPTSGYIEFRGDHGQIFSPGDYVVAHQGDFDTSHILRGRVVAVEADRLTMTTRGAPIAAELTGGGWIVDKLPARIGFRQAHHALYGAMHTSGPERLEVLFRPESPEARRLVSTDDGRYKPDDNTATLNASQQQAVRRAVASPAGALIQGPPGTGKTTVIAHAVRELVARGKKVLVSAFTNTAVDTILTKLLEVGFDDFLRVGRASRSPDLARTLAASGRDANEFFSADLAADLVSLDVLADDVLAKSVIASTAHRCVSSPVMELLGDARGDHPFDVAIVDEAAQITEPMTLAAINLGERFVLVGDHRQLPPIVDNEQAHSHFVEGVHLHSDDAADADAPLGTSRFELAEELVDLGCAGLDRSLFERLVGHLPHVMLDEQYRMNDAIMAFSNEAFYGGKLHAHDSVRAHTLALTSTAVTGLEAPLAEVLAPSHPLVFVDVDHDGQARHNATEARALVDTVAALLDLGDDAETTPTIGVVSPFRAQVYLIRTLLADTLGKAAAAIDVDTVERFQGSERDVILVSLVKTERAGDFLADERRLNVTLTRAKKKLVVFGSRACLELNPLYRRLIEQSETHLVDWNQ